MELNLIISSFCILLNNAYLVECCFYLFTYLFVSLFFLGGGLLVGYFHNISSNTLSVLKAMSSHGVHTLIYSSTCATYGEPEKMPITEETPQVTDLLKKFRLVHRLTCQS